MWSYVLIGERTTQQTFSFCPLICHGRSANYFLSHSKLKQKKDLPRLRLRIPCVTTTPLQMTEYSTILWLLLGCRAAITPHIDHPQLTPFVTAQAMYPHCQKVVAWGITFVKVQQQKRSSHYCRVVKKQHFLIIIHSTHMIENVCGQM
jgi:hypothetical protein